MATMKTLNGYGFDSAKLGGRAPEYFTWTNNLLMNSNFARKYLINLNGKTEYTDIGKVYNGWYKESTSVLTLADDYITINNSKNSSSEQIIYTVRKEEAENLIGKTVTLAICTSNDDVYCASSVVSTDTPCAVVFTENFDLTLHFFTNSDSYQLARLIVKSGKITSIKWIVLYEGAYTVDALPQPQWLHPRLEMIRMGLPTQPRNLLDNSDFRNPVNQRGQTSYFGSGYTIDRWENNSAACKLTVEDGYIHMQNSGSTSTATQFIRQKIENPSALIGKTITIAARVKGNCRLGCEGIGLTYPSYVNCADWTTITLTVDISAMTDSYIAAVLQGSNKSEWYCSWIALYEGSYTADTLPPYVPKGKHVEMLNCGVSLTPHNLFDNSDFRNPVNQRGIYSAGSGAYIIDRWLIVNSNFTGNITITQSANGITITNDAGADTVAMVQRFIDKSYYDNKYTVVVKTTDSLNFGYTEIFNSENGICQASIWLPTGTTVVWAALYEGSYTADTLPPYVPKGYAAEFAECRRYFRRYTADNASLILSGFVTGGAKDISVHAPELAPMRTKNVSIAYSGSGVIIRGVSGYATECSNSSTYGDISVSPYQNNSSFCATIDINKKDGTAWGLTNNTPVAIQFAKNSTLDYIADL